MIRQISITVAAAVALSLGACGSTQTAEDDRYTSESVAEMKPVNTICPIGQHALPADHPYTMWNGQKVGFCCDSCSEEWSEITDEKRQRYLNEVMAGEMQG